MKHSRTTTPSANGHARVPPGPQPLPNGSNGAAPNGRTEAGRFASVIRAVPATPSPERSPPGRKALLDAVTAEDIAAVARKLRDQALDGDVAAAKVLLTYVIGRPAEAVDPDRLDSEELGPAGGGGRPTFKGPVAQPHQPRSRRGVGLGEPGIG